MLNVGVIIGERYEVDSLGFCSGCSMEESVVSSSLVVSVLAVVE